LLLATCLPFSTSVVGEFARYRPAVWLYSFNLAALSIIGYRLLALLPGLEHDEHALDRKVSLAVLTATSALCIGFSLINPANALWVYVLNPGTPHLARWIRVKQGSHDKS
jgi:hypothetical protein